MLYILSFTICIVIYFVPFFYLGILQPSLTLFFISQQYIHCKIETIRKCVNPKIVEQHNIWMNYYTNDNSMSTHSPNMLPNNKLAD